MAESKNCIRTYSGVLLNLKRPKRHDINLTDIAHGLSVMPRFGGHCKEPWTVLQHSLLVSHIIAPKFRLSALLHDAPEALGFMDVPTPLKAILPSYTKLYNRMERAVEKAFELRSGALHSDEIKAADSIAVQLEGHNLVAGWKGDVYPEWEGYAQIFNRLLAAGSISTLVQTYMNRVYTEQTATHECRLSDADVL